MAMAKRPTFATLLPTTAYLLKLKYPRARKMIECGVPGMPLSPFYHSYLFVLSSVHAICYCEAISYVIDIVVVLVALGSDFNPNAHCMSMPFVMNLVCFPFNRN